MAERLLTNGFRLYVIAVGLLGGWTYLTLAIEVTLATTILGTSWLAIAAVGAVLTIGLVTTHEEVFTLSQKQRKEFETNPLTGTPLSLYIAALVGWTIVSVGWYMTGFAGIDTVIIAYGWFAVAGLGTILTGGLCMKHWQPLRVAMGSTVRGKR